MSAALNPSETSPVADLKDDVPPNKTDNVPTSGKPKRWMADENDRLRDAVNKYSGSNWKLIAAEVATRSSVQCLQHWKHVLNPEVVQGAWSKEEDAT